MEVFCSRFSLLLLFIVLLDTSAQTSLGSPVRRAPRLALSQGIKQSLNVDENVVERLGHLGYLGHEYRSLELDHSTVRQAIIHYQTFFNLPRTGNFDNNARSRFMSSRCSFPDVYHEDKRVKRFTFSGHAWPSTNITWAIGNFSTHNDRIRTLTEVDKSLRVWSSRLGFNFTYEPHLKTHITVRFLRGQHGDGRDFDGRCNEYTSDGCLLGHAFFPGTKLQGEIHLDDDEEWTTVYDDFDHRPIMPALAHEIGHALGLGHSRDEDALMWPYYKYGEDVRINKDDIAGIEFLYGKISLEQPKESGSSAKPSSSTQTYPTESPPIEQSTETQLPKLNPMATCEGHFDAAFSHRDKVVMFCGRRSFLVSRRGTSPGSSVVRHRLSLPASVNSVDAAYYSETSNSTYLFVGSSYYVMNENNSSFAGPLALTQLGLPQHLNKVDAAAVFSHKMAMIIAGDVFWMFNEEKGIVANEPRTIRKEFPGVILPVDAAFFDSFTWKWVFISGKQYTRIGLDGVAEFGHGQAWQNFQ